MSQVQTVGVDVSARSLAVEIASGEGIVRLEVPNTPAGHRALIRRLTKRGRAARVCLESTGVYGLDLALALEQAPRIEVMVVNPRAAKRFAGALMQRSKTDAIDAGVLREYAARMPFEPWRAPEPLRLELRSLCRRIQALIKMQTQEKNRLHAAGSTRTASALIRNDIEVNLRHLERRISRLEAQALELLGSDAELLRAFEHITSIRGFGARSAMLVLAELAVLPPQMTPRQWTAHAGLDPRQTLSGESLHRPARISRAGNVHLRRPLYMPALVACQHEPQVEAFYNHLLARGKKPLQAIVAIMRKLLHSIHGMLHHDADFEGLKFYATQTTHPQPTAVPLPLAAAAETVGAVEGWLENRGTPSTASTVLLTT